MCCGAAGHLQPRAAADVGGAAGAQGGAVREHRPDVIVTANPGCQMQYEAAVRDAGIEARVMHIVEVLDEAYRRADAAKPSGSSEA